MAWFHPTVKGFEHWLADGGLFVLFYNIAILPFYRYVVSQAIFGPLWKRLNVFIQQHFPIPHAQFAHYHRKHEAPNPRVCELEPCVIVP